MRISAHPGTFLVLTGIIAIFVTLFLPFALSSTPSSSRVYGWPASNGAQDALGVLGTALRDPNLADRTLAVLQVTADAELVPLFVAYSGHANRRVRLICASALAGLGGEAASAALLERAKNEPIPALRAQAIAILIQKKAAPAAQLQEALKNDDENVRYLAAHGLVAMGQGALAAETLAQLAQSKIPATAGLAALDLVGLGQTRYVEIVSSLLADANTPPLAIGLMLERIYEEKIAAAAAAVEKVALSSAVPDSVRLHAYRAMSAISPTAPDRLREALAATDKPNFRVLLFRALAAHEAAGPHLKALAGGKDLLAALAQFQLARPAKDSAAAKAAADAIAHGHPIIVEHVLSCLRDDLAGEANLPARGAGEESKMDVYVPLLLNALRGAPKEPDPARTEQDNCARAATLLGDIGSPAALDGLKAVLAGPFSEAKRAAVAGLARTKNPAAASLLKPVLDSPYPELSATAAIGLARHGEKDAARMLQDILNHSSRYNADLTAMAAWHSLKLAGRQSAAIEELAKTAK
jgi:HEAT repeat protein